MSKLRLYLLATSIGAASVAACTAPCGRDDGGEPVPYRDGIRQGDGYWTSPPEGPYLRFESGVSYEIFHELGAPPQTIDAMLSFQRCPMLTPCSAEDDETGGATFSAGNLVIVDDVNSESVIVRNDTCADLFLRVTLLDPLAQ